MKIKSLLVPCNHLCLYNKVEVEGVSWTYEFRCQVSQACKRLWDMKCASWLAGRRTLCRALKPPDF